MDIIYIRCSTQDQEPKLQINDIRSAWDVTSIVYEENESAFKENAKRPIFDELQKLIVKGKVSNLYVWDLDRIYRNRVKLKDFFILCQNGECKIHSYNQKWLETINEIQKPFDEIMMDLLVNLLGWMGQEESEKRSSRVKNAVTKRNGTTYSYKGNKWGRKGISTHTKNKIIKLHQQGRSVREIASEVIIYDKNNNGRNISKSTVHKIISENTVFLT